MPFTPHEIEWTPEKSARMWDFYASSPAHWPQYFGAQTGVAVANFLRRHTALEGFRSIVDVSCGRGDLLAALRQALPSGNGSPRRLVGLEFSERSLSVCRERFGGRWPDVEFRSTREVVGSGEPLADLLIATEVIEHLDDGELAVFLGDLARLAFPGATVFVSTPNNEDYDASKVCCPDCGCVFHRWQHRRVWTSATLSEALESAGWRTVFCEPVHWGDYQPDTRSWLGRLLSSVVNRFRTPPPRTGLAFIGVRK